MAKVTKFDRAVRTIKKVKECPFCGGEAVMEQTMYMYHIVCHGCLLDACWFGIEQNAVATELKWNNRQKESKHVDHCQ